MDVAFCLQVDCVAAGLLAIGLAKGDRLCVWGPNSYGWVLMQFATAKAGIILVGPSSRDEGIHRLHLVVAPVT